MKLLIDTIMFFVTIVRKLPNETNGRIPPCYKWRTSDM